MGQFRPVKARVGNDIVPVCEQFGLGQRGDIRERAVFRVKPCQSPAVEGACRERVPQQTTPALFLHGEQSFAIQGLGPADVPTGAKQIDRPAHQQWRISLNAERSNSFA